MKATKLNPEVVQLDGDGRFRIIVPVAKFPTRIALIKKEWKGNDLVLTLTPLVPQKEES